MFNDQNSDAQHQTNEPGLAGWQVFIDSNKNGLLDSGEVSTSTDAAGNYAFSGLAAGSYRVREVKQTNWRQVGPTSGFYDVTISQGQSIVAKNFGNTQKVVIIGAVFSDANGDGLQDNGETGLAKQTVFIDANQNGLLDPGEVRTTTNSNGIYVFLLDPGSYRVRQLLPPNTQLSAPSRAFTT